MKTFAKFIALSIAFSYFSLGSINSNAATNLLQLAQGECGYEEGNTLNYSNVPLRLRTGWGFERHQKASEEYARERRQQAHAYCDNFCRKESWQFRECFVNCLQQIKYREGG